MKILKNIMNLIRERKSCQLSKREKLLIEQDILLTFKQAKFLSELGSLSSIYLALKGGFDGPFFEGLKGRDFVSAFGRRT